MASSEAGAEDWIVVSLADTESRFCFVVKTNIDCLSRDGIENVLRVIIALHCTFSWTVNVSSSYRTLRSQRAFQRKEKYARLSVG